FAARRQDIDRRLDWFVFVFAQMPRGRRRRAVNRAVAKPQKPGLRLVATLALDIVAGPLRIVIGRVAIDRLLLAVDRYDLFLVVIAGVFGIPGPVPDDLIIPIAAEARVGPSVPLSDLCRLIAVLPEDARPEGTLFGIVRAARILALHSHRLDSMWIATGQQI